MWCETKINTCIHKCIISYVHYMCTPPNRSAYIRMWYGKANGRLVRAISWRNTESRWYCRGSWERGRQDLCAFYADDTIRKSLFPSAWTSIWCRASRFAISSQIVIEVNHPGHILIHEANPFCCQFMKIAVMLDNTSFFTFSSNLHGDCSAQALGQPSSVP